MEVAINMLENSIYGDNIIKIIKEDKLIPRRLKYKEKLKLYHKYYIEEYGLVKVTEVFMIDNTEYYTISFDNKIACISYPIDNKNNFELLIDYDKIYKDNLINCDRLYTGSEIRYWFIRNNILDHKPYQGFIDYLKYEGRKSIIDNCKYKVIYNKKDKITKCKIEP
jgi:hypothetical protein